jgi:hypothetical protein
MLVTQRRRCWDLQQSSPGNGALRWSAHCSWLRAGLRTISRPRKWRTACRRETSRAAWFERSIWRASLNRARAQRAEAMWMPEKSWVKAATTAA